MLTGLITARVRSPREGNVFSLFVRSQGRGAATPSQVPSPFPDIGPRSFLGGTLVFGPMFLLGGDTPRTGVHPPGHDWGTPPPPETGYAAGGTLRAVSHRRTSLFCIYLCVGVSVHELIFNIMPDITALTRSPLGSCILISFACIYLQNEKLLK